MSADASRKNIISQLTVAYLAPAANSYSSPFYYLILNRTIVLSHLFNKLPAYQHLHDVVVWKYSNWMINLAQVLNICKSSDSKGCTFIQKRAYRKRTAPMPTWKRIANVAGTVDVGKLFKFTPSHSNCKEKKSVFRSLKNLPPFFLNLIDSIVAQENGNYGWPKVF